MSPSDVAKACKNASPIPNGLYWQAAETIEMLIETLLAARRSILDNGLDASRIDKALKVDE